MTLTRTVPVASLAAQYATIKGEIDAAVHRVLDSGWYVLGAEVAAFEREFAAYCGTARAVGVANGTDALMLALEALGIGPGDEVITSPMTAAFTVFAIQHVGATPVFVDIEAGTANLDPALIEAAITPRTRALMPVHLYGQAADLAPMLDIAQRHGLHLIEDAAQAHGAIYDGKRVGSIGVVGCFSFYPSKNLGAAGDGGAVTTNDPALADRIASMRHGGQQGTYNHVLPGYNSRLDEMQAAILRVKLTHLDDWSAARRAHAARYDELLAGARSGIAGGATRGIAGRARLAPLCDAPPAAGRARRLLEGAWHRHWGALPESGVSATRVCAARHPGRCVPRRGAARARGTIAADVSRTDSGRRGDVAHAVREFTTR